MHWYSWKQSQHINQSMPMITYNMRPFLELKIIKNIYFYECIYTINYVKRNFNE